MAMDIKQKIKRLPDLPGVYLMKDASGKIIYIGKAISLKKRVGSYFTAAKNRQFKEKQMIAQIHDFKHRTVNSETEAFLLEVSLIKAHRPKYNIELRDGKSYPLVKITAGEFPAIFICRSKKKEGGEFCGPYVNAGLLREAVDFLRRVFPFRSCRKIPKKSCLDFHLKLCPGPCIGKISKKDYQQNIANIRLILEGKQDELYSRLKQAMQEKAKAGEFEAAAILRDQLLSLASLYSAASIKHYPPAHSEEARQLKEILRLALIPERIEALDISHISAVGAVGSVVSFYRGKPDKQNYRRFRIKEVKGNNDFQMLAEVSQRRYTRLKNEGAALPDLIVVDGGRGQVSAVKKELDKLGLNIPLLGLAKEKEAIFLLGRKDALILPSDSPALFLLKRLRDEAHRFAQSYHHLLRRKDTFEEKK